MNEVIRLLNIIIDNQQVTGKRFKELENKIDANTRFLSQVESNQNVINKNINNLMGKLSGLDDKIKYIIYSKRF